MSWIEIGFITTFLLFAVAVIKPLLPKRDYGENKR